MIIKQLICDKHPQAIAASSLKKLRKTYNGACLRLRRSSDNTATDIGFAANGQIDIDSAISFCNGSNGFAQTIYNQISGTDLIQSTPGWQAQLINNGSPFLFNEKYYLKFGYPIGYPWVSATTLGLIPGIPFTIYAEFISTIASNFDAILSNFKVSDSSAQRTINLWNTQGNVSSSGTGGDFTSTSAFGFPSVNTPRFAWMWWNPASNSVSYENSNGYGATATNVNSPPTGTFNGNGVFYVGLQGDNSFNQSNYLDGYLNTLIIWDRLIPRQTIQSKSLEVT